MSKQSSSARTNGAQHASAQHASAHVRVGRTMASAEVRAVAQILGLSVEQADARMPDAWRAIKHVDWCVAPLYIPGRFAPDGTYQPAHFARNTSGEHSGQIAVLPDYDSWQRARRVFNERMRDGRLVIGPDGRYVWPTGHMCHNPVVFVSAIRAGWLDAVMAADSTAFTRKAFRVDSDGFAHETRDRNWNDMVVVLWDAIRVALPKEYAVWDSADRLHKLVKSLYDARRAGKDVRIKSATQAVEDQATILRDAWAGLWPASKTAAEKAIDEAMGSGCGTLEAPWVASKALMFGRVTSAELRSDESGPPIAPIAGLIAASVEAALEESAA